MKEERLQRTALVVKDRSFVGWCACQTTSLWHCTALLEWFLKSRTRQARVLTRHLVELDRKERFLKRSATVSENCVTRVTVHPDNALSPCVWIWLVLLIVRAWLLCPLRGVCRGQLGLIWQVLTRQDDLSQWDSCMYITWRACIRCICAQRQPGLRLRTVVNSPWGIHACYAINVFVLFIWVSCNSTTLRSQSNTLGLSLSPANLWAPVSGLCACHPTQVIKWLQTDVPFTASLRCIITG